MTLDTTDGVALLGYAGLGATAVGTEPATWMSNVLRGRNLTLEKSLGVLADAIKRKLPAHLEKFPDVRPIHQLLVPAFLEGSPRLYTIDLALAPDRRLVSYRYTRHEVQRPLFRHTPRVVLSGTGGFHLVRQKWNSLGILRLMRAHSRGDISDLTVADHLARLNVDVHDHITDHSVGPRCIAIWRHRKGSRHSSGGGVQFYTKATRDNGGPLLPSIGTGTDWRAVLTALTPHIMEAMKSAQGGQSGELDREKINDDLAKLPETPNEDLP